MFVKPSQAPIAARILISPPPKLSGCFFISSKDATTGRRYPIMAPRELFVVDNMIFSPSRFPANTAYAKPPMSKGDVNISGRYSMRLSISVNSKRIMMKKANQGVSLEGVERDIRSRIADDIIPHPKDRIK